MGKRPRRSRATTTIIKSGSTGKTEELLRPPFRPSRPKAYAACKELHGSCGCEERKSDPCSSWIPVLRRAHALGRDDIVAMERERMAQEKSALVDGL